MVRSVEGVFRDGKIELLEPSPVAADARVIVTFLVDDGRVDLAARGISTAQSADLRGRLKSFAEDWDRADMDGYDAL